ncbi:uncharacterized protein TNCV_3759911 [Trichonephila clavipes]|nr:uncharacterized protein TNCV_3759911 [Trichonephila clavipes]
MSVKDTYGLNSVTKFECIGHVQKRVGSRLRKLKTKTKGLSGKGKLTDNFIDRLQNYYGIAVRSNVGNLTAMQQNVIAALYHCASSDKKPMHGQCPIGKESWCYFQRGVANGTKCFTKYAGLSNDVLNKIKPVYLELCDKQILRLPSEAEEENCDLIVLDDMMNDATSEISQMFSVGSHHKKYSIILITQNLFPRVKSMRDISLNAHYIILFRNNRDVSQAACFGRQASPGRGKFFMDSCKKATKEPFSYLLLDVHPRSPEVQRLRRSLFPDHGMINWVFVPKEK